MRHRTAATIMVTLWIVAMGATQATAQGFFYGGPLVLKNKSNVNVGIGGEKRIYAGLAAVFNFSIFATGGIGGPTGGPMVSANGSYNFRLRNAKLEPFFTAGVSALSIGSNGEGGGAGGPNVGGGLTYWIKESRGIRGEYRSHHYRVALVQLQHEIRFGWVWRKGR